MNWLLIVIYFLAVFVNILSLAYVSVKMETIDSQRNNAKNHTGLWRHLVGFYKLMV